MNNPNRAIGTIKLAGNELITTASGLSFNTDVYTVDAYHVLAGEKLPDYQLYFKYDGVLKLPDDAYVLDVIQYDDDDKNIIATNTMVLIAYTIAKS